MSLNGRGNRALRDGASPDLGRPCNRVGFNVRDASAVRRDLPAGAPSGVGSPAGAVNESAVCFIADGRGGAERTYRMRSA